MRLLQTLRTTHRLARLVLASWLLVLGVAACSPAVHPQGLAWVCSGAGLIKLADLDGDQDTLTGQLDCPVCAGPVPPPPGFAMPAAWLMAMPTCVRLAHTDPGARSSGAALPARGPPASV